MISSSANGSITTPRNSAGRIYGSISTATTNSRRPTTPPDAISSPASISTPTSRCDPALGLSLREFLSLLPVKDSASGLGIDVGQCLDSETRIDPSRPYLQQRRYAGVYPRYTKPSVMASPCRWGSGLHRIKGHNFHTVKDLYLFHFGGFDLDRIKEKMGDKELIGNGWGRHMHKRAATIHAVTETVRRGRVRPWSVTKTLRRLEQWLRPIFAVNKPTLLGHKAIVEIPQRFRDVL